MADMIRIRTSVSWLTGCFGSSPSRQALEPSPWFSCPMYLLRELASSPVQLARATTYLQRRVSTTSRWEMVNVTVGGYGFPYLHQKDIFSPGLTDVDVERTSLYAGLLVLKAANWSLTYEVQMFGGGEIDLGSYAPVALDFEYAFDMAGRLEFYPSTMAQVSTIGVKPVGRRVMKVVLSR